jgi:hypothetical protein
MKETVKIAKEEIKIRPNELFRKKGDRYSSETHLPSATATNIKKQFNKKLVKIAKPEIKLNQNGQILVIS